jgi:hypothetical protein
VGGPASENSFAAGLSGESLPPSADVICGGGATGPASPAAGSTRGVDVDPSADEAGAAPLSS